MPSASCVTSSKAGSLRTATRPTRLSSKRPYQLFTCSSALSVAPSKKTIFCSKLGLRLWLRTTTKPPLSRNSLNIPLPTPRWTSTAELEMQISTLSKHYSKPGTKYTTCHTCQLPPSNHHRWTPRPARASLERLVALKTQDSVRTRVKAPLGKRTITIERLLYNRNEICICIFGFGFQHRAFLS